MKTKYDMVKVLNTVSDKQKRTQFMVAIITCGND